MLHLPADVLKSKYYIPQDQNLLRYFDQLPLKSSGKKLLLIRTEIKSKELELLIAQSDALQLFAVLCRRPDLVCDLNPAEVRCAPRHLPKSTWGGPSLNFDPAEAFSTLHSSHTKAGSSVRVELIQLPSFVHLPLDIALCTIRIRCARLPVGPTTNRAQCNKFFCNGCSKYPHTF